MLLTSISFPVCPSTGHIVSLSELLANVSAVVVTLIQPDHPAGRGILSHSPAHPSFRPLLCISPSLLAGRWLKITDVAPERAASAHSLSAANTTLLGMSWTMGVLRTIPSASRRAQCLFLCWDTESGRKRAGEGGRGLLQISLFWIKNKSRDFKNYKMRFSCELKTRTPVERRHRI